MVEEPTISLSSKTTTGLLSPLALVLHSPRCFVFIRHGTPCIILHLVLLVFFHNAYLHRVDFDFDFDASSEYNCSPFQKDHDVNLEDTFIRNSLVLSIFASSKGLLYQRVSSDHRTNKCQLKSTVPGVQTGDHARHAFFLIWNALVWG